MSTGAVQLILLSHQIVLQLDYILLFCFFSNDNCCLTPVLVQGNLLLTGDKDQLVMLLDQINTPFVRSNPSVLQGLLRIIPYLSFGELEKMRILVERFKPCCSFDKWASFNFSNRLSCVRLMSDNYFRLSQKHYFFRVILDFKVNFVLQGMMKSTVLKTKCSWIASVKSPLESKITATATS